MQYSLFNLSANPDPYLKSVRTLFTFDFSGLTDDSFYKIPTTFKTDGIQKD